MRARQLTVAAALFLLIGAGQTLGAEPSAAGLWQSLDEDSHQPNAWFLIRDNGGLYEGTIVRMFMIAEISARKARRLPSTYDYRITLMRKLSNSQPLGMPISDLSGEAGGATALKAFRAQRAVQKGGCAG
jgi:hypothetical protein